MAVAPKHASAASNRAPWPSSAWAKRERRTSMPQSAPTHPGSHVHWPPAQLPWPEHSRGHVAISSMSFSQPAPPKPAWQRQTSGEWPGEPEATHCPRPEHGFRDSAT